MGRPAAAFEDESEGMTKRRGGIVVLVSLALACVAVAPVSAGGGVLAAEAADIELSSDRFPVVKGADVPPGSTPTGMLIWSQGRRAYQLARSPGNELAPDQLVAIDLSSFREVARVDTSTLPTTTVGGFAFMEGPIPSYFTLDPKGRGRIFAFYQPKDRSSCGLSFCIGGIYALDATSLAPLGEFPLSPLLGVAPGRGALSYAAGKLYAVVSQVGNEGLANDLRDRSNVAWLTQIDAETGAMDWAVRLEACNSDPALKLDATGQYAVTRAQSGRDGSAVYVGCHGSGRATRVVRVPLDPSGNPGAQQAFPGPRYVEEIRADAESGRMLLKSSDGDNTAWWVFDGLESAFVGVIGVGPYNATQTTGIVDPATGRFYMLAPKVAKTAAKPASDGGLLVADIRRTPLPQGQPSVELAPLASTTSGPLAVESAQADTPRRIFVYRNRQGSAPPYWSVITDRRPISLNPPADDPDQRTVDVEERDGVTSASYVGTARGYGVRTLLIGGAEAVARDPSADTSVLFQNFLFKEPEGPCGPRDRELVLGSAGPGKQTDQGADAQAQAAILDPVLTEDGARPASRCAGRDVPSAPELPTRFTSSGCVAPDADPARRSGSANHATLPGFSSSVRCGESSTGSGRAIAVTGLGPVTVGSASSAFELKRDPKRGLVARVTSEVRGIDIGGVVQIDSVSAVVESWANGRRQSASTAKDANCDRTRSAGTCVERSVIGVTAGSFRCGTGKPCGDEAALVAGLQKALGNAWQVRIRTPDAGLARGSAGGYLAAIQKPAAELFSDGILNNDSLPTLPTLELIHFADGQKGRGRQIYQFAGAELATTYGIELLPQEEAQPPAQLRLELTDDAGEALAGGIFKVYGDDDGDGQVDALDKLIEGGTCVTTEDGTGSCEFKGLLPGPYVVQQTAAPPGYQASPDRFLLLESGFLSTATFTNRKAVGVVEITLADDASPAKPLEGGRFDLVADDGDGSVGAGDKSYGECTTDGEGACGFDDVPLGAYVVRQVAAPADYLRAGDAAFALSQPGETARVAFVTGLAGVEGSDATSGDEALAEEESASDAAGQGTLGPTSVEVIIEEGPPPRPAVVVTTPISEMTPVERSGGGRLRRLLGAPGEVGRFFARNPGEALLFGATWLLLAGAAVLVVRRRSLTAVASMGESPFDGPLRLPEPPPVAEEAMAGAAES